MPSGWALALPVRIHLIDYSLFTHSPSILHAKGNQSQTVLVIFLTVFYVLLIARAEFILFRADEGIWSWYTPVGTDGAKARISPLW